jgi:hypothetical protein
MARGHSHCAKTSSRLVKAIPVIAFLFLFRKVKTALKGKIYQDIEGIKEDVT